MSHKHNKRRNSLLIYEFLIKSISTALIDDDKKKSASSLKILRRHFKQGTNLYKEFRLMNSLVKTTVSSDHVAASIIKEAKTAAVLIDAVALDREKSLLIRHINHEMNDELFYDQQVNEYRNYATVQLLVNEWRSPSADFVSAAKLEDQLMKLLVTEKAAAEEHTITEDSAGTSRLLMKVMTKKLNEKYSCSLSEQQKKLMKAYAFSMTSDDKSAVSLKLSEIKTTLLDLIESYGTDASNNSYLRDKLSETKTALMNESVEDVNDAAVTRFMLYSKLCDELGSKE